MCWGKMNAVVVVREKEIVRTVVVVEVVVVERGR